eukprot:2271971-Prymnesium_polylepis.1
MAEATSTHHSSFSCVSAPALAHTATVPGPIVDAVRIVHTSSARMRCQEHRIVVRHRPTHTLSTYPLCPSVRGNWADG